MEGSLDQRGVEVLDKHRGKLADVFNRPRLGVRDELALNPGQFSHADNPLLQDESLLRAADFDLVPLGIDPRLLCFQYGLDDVLGDSIQLM